MFERFRARYGPLRDPSSIASTPWLDQSFSATQGYKEFAAEFAGASFDGGLCRFHDDRTGPGALVLIAEAFPEFAGRVCPFGYDWLGRQFGVDAGRVAAGQPQVRSSSLAPVRRWRSRFPLPRSMTRNSWTMQTRPWRPSSSRHGRRPTLFRCPWGPINAWATRSRCFSAARTSSRTSNSPT